MIPKNDREQIRELARKWMEWASLPIMQERMRLWKAVHDLKAERPVILFETAWIDGYVSNDELRCEDPFLRQVEMNMRIPLRQAEELNDDIVIEPHYRLGWRMRFSDYGVPVEVHSPLGADKSIAYTFSFPIATQSDISRLRPRTITVDRAETQRRRAILEEVMGDILPVKLGNFDPFISEFAVGEYGDLGFTGNFFFGLTWQLYRFIGNDRLLYWVYDEPASIHQIMEYLLADRIALFSFLEKERLIDYNTDSQMAGPRSYGYVSDLPAPNCSDPPRLKNLWGWAESQEFEMISPAMFQDFVLPYLARLSEHFGLVYYGCCERVDDRLPFILKSIPNLRSVSVSGWSDLAKTAELLGKKYVFSRKPTPAYISGSNVDWDRLESDMKNTREVTRDSNLEILFRDVYTINGDRARLRQWVDMTKRIFEI